MFPRLICTIAPWHVLLQCHGNAMSHDSCYFHDISCHTMAIPMACRGNCRSMPWHLSKQVETYRHIHSSVTHARIESLDTLGKTCRHRLIERTIRSRDTRNFKTPDRRTLSNHRAFFIIPPYSRRLLNFLVMIYHNDVA